MKNRTSAVKIIAILSAMHFMTDFICAFVIYSWLTQGRTVDVILYNFCAFVLQMPLGLLADVMKTKGKEDSSVRFITLGALLTMSGLFDTPVRVFGLGNALFHVGGGIITMHKDQENSFRGRGLGSFVAPGALGLFAGAGLAGYGFVQMASVIVMTALWICMILAVRNSNPERESFAAELDDAAIVTILVTLMVVIIRSYVGLAVSFGWKQGLLLSLLNVVCVACGKTLGGFTGNRYGYKKTVVVSLLLATVFYAFGSISICGLLAVLLFNMTMPVTLYLLAEKMKHLEGFAFGILTFGLFIGYYVKVTLGIVPVDPGVIGAVGSRISLVLLYSLVRKREK